MKVFNNVPRSCLKVGLAVNGKVAPQVWNIVEARQVVIEYLLDSMGEHGGYISCFDFVGIT